MVWHVLRVAWFSAVGAGDHEHFLNVAVAVLSLATPPTAASSGKRHQSRSLPFLAAACTAPVATASEGGHQAFSTSLCVSTCVSVGKVLLLIACLSAQMG